MYFKKQGDVPPVSAVGWGPDGRYACMKRSDKILRVDLKTGQEEVLYQTPPDDVLGGVVVAPDGRSIAFNVFVRRENQFRLFVIPSGGGALRDLVSATARVVPGGWTRNGRQLLFVRTTADETNGKHIGELWAVPFEGGSARSLGLTTPALRDVSVSPLGDRIAFTSGYPDKGIWVFKNFLPQTASR